MKRSIHVIILILIFLGSSFAEDDYAGKYEIINIGSEQYLVIEKSSNDKILKFKVSSAGENSLCSDISGEAIQSNSNSNQYIAAPDKNGFLKDEAKKLINKNECESITLTKNNGKIEVATSKCFYLCGMNSTYEGSYSKAVKREGEVKTFYPSGGIREIAYYKNEKLDGKRTIYSENGAKREEGNFVKGELNGEFIDYYPNGKIKNLSMWEDSKKNGVEKEYFENGKLKIESLYKNGNKNGAEKEYNLDGKLIRHFTFLNYRPNGPIMIVNSKGMRVEYNIKEGKPQGEYKEYYPSGNQAVLSHLNAKGKLEGEFLYFHDSPEKNLMAKSYYVDGKKVK